MTLSAIVGYFPMDDDHTRVFNVLKERIESKKRFEEISTELYELFQSKMMNFSPAKYTRELMREGQNMKICDEILKAYYN